MESYPVRQVIGCSEPNCPTYVTPPTDHYLMVELGVDETHSGYAFSFELPDGWSFDTKNNGQTARVRCPQHRISPL